MSTNRFLGCRPGACFLLGLSFAQVLAGQANLYWLMVVKTYPRRAHPQSSPSSPSNLSSPEAAGLQAACWALTVPYGAAKMAYAIGGGIVGGLAWAITGGNMEVAKSIWIPSMTGDYIVQPQHLTGEKHLYFVGVSSEAPLS